MKLPPADALMLALLPGPLGLTELAQALGQRPSQVKLTLGLLAHEGDVVRQGDGWALHPRHHDRIASLARHTAAARERAERPDQRVNVYEQAHPFHKGRIPPKY